MGGNALKNCTIRRYKVDEYKQAVLDVSAGLRHLFGVRPYVIPAYRKKESFGDLDILVESEKLPSDWVERIVEFYNPKEYVKNSNVLSFEYNQLQVDLIAAPSDEIETSYNYFAYNDLGNLLGRVAHSLGLKLGHRGLSYQWRIDTHKFDERVLLTNWRDILPVLGYSYERYAEGFDTLEDIFEFVASSPFFNKDIYLLHNRNNYARTRDKKRPTYTAFLKRYEEDENQTWNKVFVGDDKDGWLPYLFSTIPGFKDTYDEVMKNYNDELEYKAKFNGDLVRKLTGLEGKELGMFMKYLKDKNAVSRSFVLQNSYNLIEVIVVDYFVTYKENYGKAI